MPKQKKDYVVLNIKIERSIYERLTNYAEEKGQTKTKAVERLLSNAMIKKKVKNNESKR
mgnify:CR=1 FL=1